MTSVKIRFPNPWTAETIEDVIAVGGDLTVENVVTAYGQGIFPWPHPGYPLLWFCPEQRGILDFADLHVSTSLKKWIRKHQPQIEIKINSDFAEVIKACRKQKRPGQKGSWITLPMEKTYIQMSTQGFALSLECYQDEQLIAGIYGVKSEYYFSCESMFYKIDNGSKYAFIKLVEYLKSQGHTWMDLQMITEVSEAFGAKYISRSEFLKRINLKRKP